MLPDYDLESRRDPAMEQEALKIINQVIEVAEKDILVALGSGFDVGISLARAARGFLLQTVESVAERHQQHPILFPFQIYLFSQAEGDTTAARSETAIMQAYLSSLCSSCVRILTKSLLFIKQTSRVADVISALRETALGHLLPYAVNVLYVGTFAMDVISYASGDLLELLTMWCQLMKMCCIDVGIGGF